MCPSHAPLVFADDKLRQDQAARAASITTGALAFRDLILTYALTIPVHFFFFLQQHPLPCAIVTRHLCSEQLTPDTARDKPLCSIQYK